MNLFAIPLGAMPMCHGSGGVAGKYAFGARTAGANVILGSIYAVAAVLAVGIVAAFPPADARGCPRFDCYRTRASRSRHGSFATHAWNWIARRGDKHRYCVCGGCPWISSP
nr:putative sulfate/molybdate transporter [Halorussus salinisoli]